MTYKSWLVGTFATFLAIFVLWGKLMPAMHSSDSSIPVQVWMPWSPTTTEPLEFDSFAHHVAFRSVLGSLVTQYRLGTFAGLLSDKWTISEDRKTWKFHIRPNTRFENGDVVTPAIVIQSWTRMAMLMNRKNSHSDLFDLIEGMQTVHKLNAPVVGLSAAGDAIVIQLKKPFPKLLETISFGIYAVVHPNDYDSVTGNWKDPKKLLSANAYRIVTGQRG
jgi:oligopeptide transport system substrate-binding protein